MLYSSFGDFTDYEPVTLKYFEVKDRPSIADYDRQVRIITNYNNYMNDHTWAMKNPNSRTITDFIGRSGRINNYYQSIVNRRIPIRSHTLIDDERIKEPGFSCNHLRMASYLVGEELPEDPYSVIAEEAGVTRDVIKSVLTASIGAASLNQKGGQMQALNKKGLVKITQYKVVIDIIEKVYPWVKAQSLMFNDVGTRMQYLEGEIALEMMKWAVEEGVPLIPVHDSFAVRYYDEEKTFNRMLEVWRTVMAAARKNKYLQKTQYTVNVVKARKVQKKAIQG